MEDYSTPLLRSSFLSSCARAVLFKSHCRPSSPRTTTEGNKGEHRQTRYRRNSGCIARDSACLSGIIVVYIRSYVFQQIASVDLRIGERVCEHGNGRAKEDGGLARTLYSLSLANLPHSTWKQSFLPFLSCSGKVVISEIGRKGRKFNVPFVLS